MGKALKLMADIGAVGLSLVKDRPKAGRFAARFRASLSRLKPTAKLAARI